MVTSFFSSVLFLQPVKAVLFAVVFASFIRKPADTETESNGITLAREDHTFEEQTEILSPVPESTKVHEGTSEKYLR